MSPRTSKTHPLQIQHVIPPGTTGRIGMTLCPGKKQANALTGEWDRDLDLDLKAIVEWGGRVLVSLIEDHEFDQLGVRALADHARVHGIEWIHLPIGDFSTPTQVFELGWQTKGPALRQHLAAGDSIVMHCKGGLGRTGMIAARLLVEFGVEASEAINQVRRARPGAIETSAQEKYVYQCAAIAVRGNG